MSFWDRQFLEEPYWKWALYLLFGVSLTLVADALGWEDSFWRMGILGLVTIISVDVAVWVLPKQKRRAFPRRS